MENFDFCEEGFSFPSEEYQLFQASEDPSPPTENEIQGLLGRMQSSSLPSTSRGSNLQIEQEIQGLQGMMQSSSLPSSSRGSNPQTGQEFPQAQFAAVTATMQSLILQLFTQLAPTIQPLIFQLFVEAMKTIRPSLISELMGSISEALKTTVQPFLVEEMKKMVHSSPLRSSPRQAESSAPRTLQLRFVGSLPNTLHTLTKIEDGLLRVELSDSSGSKVIEEGPESSAKVKLVVLDGDFDVDHRADWTKEEFDRNEAKPRKDKGPLLKGNSEIYLIKGVADVTDIAFTDNSKSMRNGTFRLGAQLVDGGAREAVSKKPFMVKERRLLSNNDSPLSLEHSPHRLKHIGDTNTEKLAKAKIHTVKDFLQLYHTDDKALQKILHISENKLSETVKIAEEKCTLTKEHYLYNNETEGVHLVLDCVFNIKGVTFKGGTSQAFRNLDDSKKKLVKKLRVHAYETRKKLPRTDELGTRYYGAKWISVRAAVVVMIAIKISIKQGPRAAKRPRLE